MYSFSGRTTLGLIHPNQPRTCSITFDPKDQRGRFNDRMEFIFEDTSIHQRFAITRPIRAIVGVKEDLDALKPLAPYVRPKRRYYRPVAEQDVRDGIRPPALADIDWVVKLPQFPIPGEVFRAVMSGSRQDKVAKIRSSLLPDVLDTTTYARHWRTLLHIEEAQMR